MVFWVGLSQATARGAERAEHGRPGKLSNVLEDSRTVERILEASRRPGNLYIPLYGLVVYRLVSLYDCVRVGNGVRATEELCDIMKRSGEECKVSWLLNNARTHT